MDRTKDYQPGERVPGTVYCVIRMIGAGGMGTVYDVEDTTVGKRYVLKTLHPELYGRKDLARRMEAEARTLARLSHPNIVEVVTAGATTDDMRLPYYVMEKLNGQNLRTILDKKGSLELPHALHIGIDLLDALDNAHDKGVIHRDVKPDNIFLHRNPNGLTTTKLLDFGIMRLLDAGPGLTAGRFMGTLRYAAPEQLRGESLSPQADLYAAGLVVYEMIAGVGPFDELKDSNKIAAAHLSRVPPLFRDFDIEVPEALERLVRTALSKEAGKRPKDAFTFAAQLRNVKRALSAGRISESPTSRPTEVPVVGPVTELPSAAVLRSANPSLESTRAPESRSQIGRALTEQANTSVEPFAGPEEVSRTPTSPDPSAIDLSHIGTSGGPADLSSKTDVTLMTSRTGRETPTSSDAVSVKGVVTDTQSSVVGPVDRSAATHTAEPPVSRASSPPHPLASERQGSSPPTADRSSSESRTLRVSRTGEDWRPPTSTMRMTPLPARSSAPDGDFAGQLLSLLPIRDSVPSPSRTDPAASNTVSPRVRSRAHAGVAIAVGLGATVAMAGTLSAVVWGLRHHAATSDARASTHGGVADSTSTLPLLSQQLASPLPAPTIAPPLDIAAPPSPLSVPLSPSSAPVAAAADTATAAGPAPSAPKSASISSVSVAMGGEPESPPPSPRAPQTRKPVSGSPGDPVSPPEFGASPPTNAPLPRKHRLPGSGL
jgi:serine/threonine-protein kinase